MPEAIKKLIILGSGPAGLTAAIYSARAGLKPLVVEGMMPGGQPMGTSMVENFPGFPEGIAGPEMVSRMRKQAERFGAKFIVGKVGKVNIKKKPFAIFVGKRGYRAEALIVATGADPRWLEVPGEEEMRGRGVSTCATCDGFFYKDKVVIVIGGGDSALEEAIFLTHFAKKVIVVHRRDKLRASKFLQKKALEEKKIEFYWNKKVEEVLGRKKLKGVVLRDTQTGETSELICDGIFIAIGHNPNTQIFKNQLDLDQKGYIKVSRSVETSVPGVFVAGDVADPQYKQAITAAASGCMAAMSAEEFLALEE